MTKMSEVAINDAPGDRHSIRRRIEDVDPALRAFFETALASSPERRFQTAFDFHATLESIVRSLA
jgi:hypothetical protein